jgi:nuclear pore complex protein Nup62
MDEIITRWASDLSKYQKEFQEQAAKVAQWDRLLVENGDKIQKLYATVYEAEKQNGEIERQLSNVEGQQEELIAWLDRYEGEIDEMFSKQVGPGETLQGPDQERERTYKLAETLTDRLDEMGKGLGSMIEAVNEATGTLSRTGNADDPVSFSPDTLQFALGFFSIANATFTSLTTNNPTNEPSSSHTLSVFSIAT